MRLHNQDEQALSEHMLATYKTLRRSLIVLGLTFPFLLWGVGKGLYGIPLQSSMSRYYFAPYPESPDEKIFPMRIWFAGGLFAIGAALYLYKGFTNWENVALNLAGSCAALVALVPMSIEPCTGSNCSFSWHGLFAVLLFLCLAFVALFCAQATLQYLPPEHKHLLPGFRLRYKVVGVLMVLSPLGAFVLTRNTEGQSYFIFWAEAFCVLTFAWYWFEKTREMELSKAEKKAVEEKLKPPTNKGGVIPKLAV
jgi:hypothetical protein